jgi:tetratricopeptide (TPR) repeat protein
MKKATALGLWIIGFAACATLPPPPPSLYLENPTPAFSSRLSLDDRIIVEDAWSYLRSGRTDKARKAILLLIPQNPFYYPGLGYAAFLEGSLPVAEENFALAVKNFPGLAVGHMGLAQVSQKTGKMTQAFREYLEVLKYDPGNAVAKRESDAIGAQRTNQNLNDALNLASLGNLAKSKEAYAQALEFTPKSREGHLGLARIYMKEKNLQSALFHLKTANTNDPKDKTILQEYADALYQAGQNSRSLDVYERLLEIDPQNKAAVDRRDNLRNRLGIIELPSEYNSIPSLTALTKEDLAALIGIKFKDLLGDPPPRPMVIVDSATSWAFRDIVKVAGYNIMSVNANRTFEPRKIVTRAELAETLIRLINFLKAQGVKIVEQVPADRIRIADVPPEHFYFKPITQVITYQIMDLAPDRTFKPELDVPGQEAIRALDILLGVVIR